MSALTQVDEIDRENILELQAMKMYLERSSIENISMNLGVSKVKIEKWIIKWNVQQSDNSENDLIYEIFDDSSVSDCQNVEAIQKPTRSNSSLATLRWSESSESETRSETSSATNFGNTEPAHSTDCKQHVADAVEIDSGIDVTIPRKLRADHKRSDLKRWKDVPCRCGTCKEKFVGLDDLRMHVQKEHLSQRRGIRLKRYGCGLCSKAFEVIGQLICHEIAAHVSHLRLT